ncbi:MAG: ATP-binding protein [Cyanobacteria bacterium P01_D01_bin.156]
MTLTASPLTWQQANQQYLQAQLTKIKLQLSQKAEQPCDLPDDPIRDIEQAAQQLESPSSLEQLCDTFELSTFERDILVLCAGMELDASIAPLCALAQGDPQKPFPTLSLALSLFTDAHWSALTPRAPLRRWRLIELGKGLGLMQRSLQVNERILHYLAGIHHLDERLTGLIEPLGTLSNLVASHQALANQLADTWAQAAEQPTLPILQLAGDSPTSQQAIAGRVCRDLNLQLHSLAGQDVPANAKDLVQFLQLWEREAILSSSALLLDCTETSLEKHQEPITRLLEQIRSPLMVTTRDRVHCQKRTILNIDVNKPSHGEQQNLWEQHLQAFDPKFLQVVPALVTQFNLSHPEIAAVCTRVFSQVDRATLTPAILQAELWDGCRLQARPQMDDLAQRITVKATWDDLVLPETQLETLRTVTAQVRQRVKVYEDWGFSSKNMRGLGISALFAGPSGTGKTTAAEILANELNLDLYRIDLSAVVSKYIGETEKNLRRVFDAAEGGGAVLLFDEADALFGKRSDVKDSHDRHANIEVSYLLQRMEAYQGLAILTTNLKGALDSAFMRRIRFVLQFTFPDVSQRMEIWRRIFPRETPTKDLSVERLARLQVAGGNIRNIALNAAFLAADAGEPVMMKHLLVSARGEYSKLEKTLTDREIKGWV